MQNKKAGRSGGNFSGACILRRNFDTFTTDCPITKPMNIIRCSLKVLHLRICKDKGVKIFKARHVIGETSTNRFASDERCLSSLKYDTDVAYLPWSYRLT